MQVAGMPIIGGGACADPTKSSSSIGMMGTGRGSALSVATVRRPDPAPRGRREPGGAIVEKHAWHAPHNKRLRRVGCQKSAWPVSCSDE
jgi:hypothetical protein